MNAFCRTSKKSGSRAQAITEFAIVLPILLVLLVGVLEVGRLLYIYAVVNNASRDAARYASAVGLDNSGSYNKFEYCKGIVEAARRFAYFIPNSALTITIEYDKGPGITPYDSCLPLDGVDDVPVSPGDRVVVTIIGTYNPLVKLIPISERQFTVSSARTILGDLNLTTGGASIPGPGPGPGGSTGTPTPTGTLPGEAPTPTATLEGDPQTPTATSSGPGVTPTPFDTSTPTPTDTPDPLATPTPTLDPNLPTATPTFLPTDTPTPTPTYTPTATSTPMPGCGNITPGSILISGNTMRMTISNPHEPITVSTVQVVWNSLTGGPVNGQYPTGSPLTLQYAILESVFWSGPSTAGDLTITPSPTITIPGNNATSTIIFTFDKSYKNFGTPSITIALSTPGCENYSIQSPPYP